MSTTDPPSINGWPVHTLTRAAPADPVRPTFVSAEVLPGRAMMLLQARLRLPGGREIELLASPPPAQAAQALDGGAEDFAGDAAFSFGCAVLAPYANRIRGKPVGPGRALETQVLGRTVRLPRNWGGKAPGAEQYAMHGLILDRAVDRLEPRSDAGTETVAGFIDAGDFGGRWLSRTDLEIAVALHADALELRVTARNAGEETLPMGIGCHPYFALPSGRREQARVHVPARRRLEVNNYDEVLPTGRLLDVQGGPYDLSPPEGAALGGLYLDDCFVDLQKDREGRTAAQITDPAGGYGLRIVAHSPEVSAVQVYAPPDKPFVVLEPQFNWADPFGPEWPAGAATGMALLQPGEAVTYRLRFEPFVPEAPARA